MEAILQAGEALFTPHLILLMLAGTVLGMLWGAMPGLTTTMAMALFVGLTYNMSTEGMIVFLMATTTSSVFGGSITAVLINIPGTPASIPTAFEGYPLAKRGEGGLALGSAIVASFYGNLLGVVALIIMVPVIISLALRFGSWEIFLLSFWGIVISGTMTDKEKPIKGWISGWVGLLIAMVGMEPIHGFERFTFDEPLLMNGFDYIAVIVGLFGLAEVLRVMAMRVPDRLPEAVGRIIPPFNMIKKYAVNIFRSAVIGITIGAVPGAGANISSFLAYDIARRRSKPEERKKYGNGSYEGLIASEVANNATIGGMLAPTMTLGIPGSVAAAIFMGALNLHAIRVGPAIEMENPGLLYFLYTSLIFANLFMYAFALVLIKPSLKVFSLRKELLMPLVVPLCVIGAYAREVVMFDVYMMLAFGLLGFAFYKMKYPLAPLILGIILGPMADENLRKAIMIFQGQKATLLDILSRPIGTILIVILILTFYDGIFRRSRER